MVVASPPQPLAKNGVTVHEMRTIHMESCRKIFIPRDYSQGLNVHFETQFPMAFRGKISETTWDSTIRTINSIFAEAEKVCFATVLETLLGLCYLLLLSFDKRHHLPKEGRRFLVFVIFQSGILSNTCFR
ncbi:hypothetical protein KIN20_024208 [Parelaphostrongylus tenuis]|uniref:Ras modification protein ERF4 n=1 Tax=Parelaphostrongylus tenuis TaxID=148309 RepID=A0AAD5QVT5_PARTN|nr:hypothetical protein KIN20_024208 [Parelaphostrongylus tenuis]